MKWLFDKILESGLEPKLTDWETDEDGYVYLYYETQKGTLVIGVFYDNVDVLNDNNLIDILMEHGKVEDISIPTKLFSFCDVSSNLAYGKNEDVCEIILSKRVFEQYLDKALEIVIDEVEFLEKTYTKALSLIQKIKGFTTELEYLGFYLGRVLWEDINNGDEFTIRFFSDCYNHEVDIEVVYNIFKDETTIYCCRSSVEIKEDTTSSDIYTFILTSINAYDERILEWLFNADLCRDTYNEIQKLDSLYSKFNEYDFKEIRRNILPDDYKKLYDQIAREKGV